MAQQMNNGIKLMTKIVALAEQRPVTAIVLSLVSLSVFIGGISFGTSFFGTGFGMSAEVAKELALLKQKDITMASDIKAERTARIWEFVRLKEDGKLQSVSDISVQIRKELDKFEDRLIARLK